jgi:hypothetical protein
MYSTNTPTENLKFKPSRIHNTTCTRSQVLNFYQEKLKTVLGFTHIPTLSTTISRTLPLRIFRCNEPNREPLSINHSPHPLLVELWLIPVLTRLTCLTLLVDVSGADVAVAEGVFFRFGWFSVPEIAFDALRLRFS